jgi:hypothetical protein
MYQNLYLYLLKKDGSVPSSICRPSSIVAMSSDASDRFFHPARVQPGQTHHNTSVPDRPWIESCDTTCAIVCRRLARTPLPWHGVRYFPPHGVPFFAACHCIAPGAHPYDRQRRRGWRQDGVVFGALRRALPLLQNRLSCTPRGHGGPPPTGADRSGSTVRLRLAVDSEPTSLPPSPSPLSEPTSSRAPCSVPHASKL